MFENFKKVIQDRLDFLIENSVTLFEIEVSKDQLWGIYLNAFPHGSNPVFRERSSHDCSCCRQFIRQIGGVAGIVDGKTETIWNISIDDPVYQIVADKMNSFVYAFTGTISNAYYSDSKKIGTDYNHELIGDIPHRWNHFYYELPERFVVGRNESVESKQSVVRQTKEVIARSFEELTPSVIDDVLEMIDAGTIYRGEEFKSVLTSFREAQKEWILSKNRDNYCWELAVSAGRFLAIRNTAIGTLLVNLSDGMDIVEAVNSFGKVMDPTNYKRVKTVYTPSQIKAAEAKITEMGLDKSLYRRHAKLEDIAIGNVLWASANSKKVMKSVFEQLKEDLPVNTSALKHIKEMGIESFIQDVLPTATHLELLVENDHMRNFVSIVAPVNKEAPSLFKWDNGFSWSYAGNFTDSIKDSVKTRGGNTEGVLRFSLSWAEGDSGDDSDLDAHCVFPAGRIYYGNRNEKNGTLDIDIRSPLAYKHKNIVENIVFEGPLSKMAKGNYEFSVHNFALRGRQNGFRAEIEFDGIIHEFTYSKPLKDKETVVVAKVEFDGSSFKIVNMIPSNLSSKNVWNVNTMKFIPVTTVMFSPNYWVGEQGIGNKHYFFTLEECINTDDQPRGFYNEFLRNELTPDRKVFEALSAKMKVEPNDQNTQLSGLGFSSTLENTITVTVNNSQTFKINFTDGKLVFNSVEEKVSV